MAGAIADKLLTAEEYARLPDNGRPTELVRGRVVTVNPPWSYHGLVCVSVVKILTRFVEDHDLGWVLGNDSGVITERDPDTVRGADVAFYSYSRVPKDEFPAQGYVTATPELVFEVVTASERWSRALRKVSEYLDAGVKVVCVMDCKKKTVHVYEADQSPQEIAPDGELVLPGVLGDFRVSVADFFPKARGPA